MGKVKDSVNIPYVICSRVWDPQEQKKVIKKEDNPDFIAQARTTQLAGQQAAGADLCSPNRQACSQAVSQAGWQSGRHGLSGAAELRARPSFTPAALGSMLAATRPDDSAHVCLCASAATRPAPSVLHTQVQRKFPNKDAKLLVACANGSQYSIDALEALDEAGYTNLVGLRGGYTAWFR